MENNVIKFVILNLNNIQLDLKIVSTHLDSIFFWRIEDYFTGEPGIEIQPSSPVGGSTFEFSITNDEVNLNTFDGVFVLEISMNKEVKKVCVANLTSYHNCLLDKVLKTEFKNCKEKKSECDTCNDTPVCLLANLLTSLEYSILTGSLKVIEHLVNEIKDICEDCSLCPKPYIAPVSNYVYNYVAEEVEDVVEEEIPLY